MFSERLPFFSSTKYLSTTTLLFDWGWWIWDSSWFPTNISGYHHLLAHLISAGGIDGRAYDSVLLLIYHRNKFAAEFYISCINDSHHDDGNILSRKITFDHFKSLVQRSTKNDKNTDFFSPTNNYWTHSNGGYSWDNSSQWESTWPCGVSKKKTFTATS